MAPSSTKHKYIVRKTDRIDELDAHLLINRKFNQDFTLRQICAANPELYGTIKSKHRRLIQNKYNSLQNTKRENTALFSLLYQKARVLGDINSNPDLESVSDLESES